MALPGTNTMLIGFNGSGKTHAIRTFIECGITPFVLFTEPGMRTLADVPEDKLHWQYVKPATVDWSDLTDQAKTIAQKTYGGLAKMESMNKQKYQQFMSVLAACTNFTCDRTGEEFGAVDSWNTDRVFVLDGLTGISKMAMDLVVGAKPTKAPGEYGVAQDNLARLLDKFTDDTQCHYVLISHIEREKDEVTGGTTGMPSTIGQKLAPKLPTNFDDVVMCRKKSATEFTWGTEDPLVDVLKNRNLASSNNLPASFVPLIESWKAAGGVIEETV